MIAIGTVPESSLSLSAPPSPASPHRPVWTELVEGEDLSAGLSRLGLGPSWPVLVLVGAADGLEVGPAAAIAALFSTSLAPLCERLGVLVVDGGTESGVMALMGRARAAAGSAFPLLGVAPSGRVRRPAEAGRPDRAALEARHSHALLVPGDRWGDEVPWMSATATWLAGDRPSLTLVAGGGGITELDVQASLAAGRPTLVLGGSGGAADRIAHGIATDLLNGQRPSGLLRALPLARARTDLPPLLEALLAGGTVGEAWPPTSTGH